MICPGGGHHILAYDLEGTEVAGWLNSIVMTGSASDDPSWQQHIRNKARRKAMATRFKDSKDPGKTRSKS